MLGIDFETQSFDVCRTERVLMYVDDPERALDEMFRVLRPSGMFAFFEFDYEGIVVDAPDRAFTRRVVRLVSDSVPSPWIGRQLPRLLRERGVEAMTVIPHMILTPFAMFSRVVSGTLAQAVQTGAIASGELKTWWRSLERAESEGGFFSGVSGFLLCGRTLDEVLALQRLTRSLRRRFSSACRCAIASLSSPPSVAAGDRHDRYGLFINCPPSGAEPTWRRQTSVDTRRPTGEYRPGCRAAA